MDGEPKNVSDTKENTTSTPQTDIVAKPARSRRIKSSQSGSSRSNRSLNSSTPLPKRPSSPRDTTPVTIDNEIVDTDSLPAISATSTTVSSGNTETIAIEPSSPVDERIVNEITSLITSDDSDINVDSGPEKGTFVREEKTFTEMSVPSVSVTSETESSPRPSLETPPKATSSRSRRTTVSDSESEDETPKRPLPRSKKKARKKHIYYSDSESDTEEERPPVQISGKAKRPDYSKLSAREKARVRERFRARFEILQENYPDIKYRKVKSDEDLDIIHDRYEECLRKVFIKGTVTDYRYYLIIFFLIIELAGTKWLGIDISGYAESQFSMMSKYDRLLIELGEKYNSDGGSGWPVEIRLFILALFNAAIFLVLKYMLGKFSPEMAEHLQKYITGYLSKSDQPRMTLDEEGVPEPPVGGSGGIPGLMRMFTNMTGNNDNKSHKDTSSESRTSRRRRKPTFTE